MNDVSGERPNAEASANLTILNQKGLHARAAAKFVKCAEMFNAEVRVLRHGMEVSGCSIMGLMMLAASPGTMIEVRARGREARAAVDALTELIGNKFDED